MFGFAASGQRRDPLFLGFAALAVIGVALAFYLPGLSRTGGVWPVPLDDVYIHFGFARSAAHGHPFQWIAGNGYSSGGTSLLYPLLLAPGIWLGLDGPSLGAFASCLACLALVDMLRSVRLLLVAYRAPRWATWLAPLCLLAVPILDWSWFSGMESAVMGAVMGRALLATHAATVASPMARASAQIRLGAWAALLIATRPETAPLALLLAIAAVHGARSLRTVPSLARTLAPSALLLMLQATVNRAYTGEWGAAGAIRKLTLSDPYATPLEMAGTFLRNLMGLRAHGLDLELGGSWWAWAPLSLGAISVLDRRTRRLGLPLLLGAAAALVLVSLNTTARYQNLRYMVTTLAMLVVSAALGIGALSRRGRGAKALAAAGLLAVGWGPAGRFARQTDHFARASGNIAEQQVEVGRRLSEEVDASSVVLVGDAGAIPFVSGLRAIDGLGLGGYRGLPFARASVHGTPAVIELIERLPESERPTLLAVYPSWFPGLMEDFGTRRFSVRIDDNIICGGDEKVVADADWTALESDHRRRARMEVDVADLVDERASQYQFPHPKGGWVVGAILLDGEGARRHDAGRIVPEGRSESFVVGPALSEGPAQLVVRTDDGPEIELLIAVHRGADVVEELPVSLPVRPKGRWHESTHRFAHLAAGDLVEVTAVRGTWRSFHYWLDRPVL